jgi:hypothetical protein
MAYDGHRPILPPRDSKQINLVTGEEEESNYSYSEGKNLSGQVLAEMPTEGSHVPGTGYYPGDVAMTRRFLGDDTQSPTDDPGLGPDTSYMGHITWPNPVPSAEAMGGAYGHELGRDSDYARHTNLEPHQGVPSADKTLVGGHLPRLQEDAPQTGGGATAPFINKGVGEAAEPMDDPGREKPEVNAEGIYGHQHVNEWKGVPSAKAL